MVIKCVFRKKQQKKTENKNNTNKKQKKERKYTNKYIIITKLIKQVWILKQKVSSLDCNLFKEFLYGVKVNQRG